MNTHQSKPQIPELLETLGLTPRQAQVYLALHKQPWITVTDLATVLDTPRPTLYRELDEMNKAGLIQARIDHKTSYYSASPTSSLERLVTKKQQSVTSMADALKRLTPLLQNADTSATKTNVSFHRGIRAIQSMEWKLIEESKEQLIFGNDTWWKYVGQDFAEEIRLERAKQKITVKEILNEEFRPKMMIVHGQILETTLKTSLPAIFPNKSSPSTTKSSSPTTMSSSLT